MTGRKLQAVLLAVMLGSGMVFGLVGIAMAQSGPSLLLGSLTAPDPDSDNGDNTISRGQSKQIEPAVTRLGSSVRLLADTVGVLR